MSQDVRSDAELLCNLCDQAPVIFDRVTGRHVHLNAKQIAAWTDRSIQTISDYKSGKTNIPVEFWRRLLEHFIDVRICALICPSDCGFDIEQVAVTGPASAPEFFREAMKAEGEHYEQMKSLACILADGRIDDLDACQVQSYSDAYQRHRLRDAALHQAIMTTFQRIREKGAVR